MPVSSILVLVRPGQELPESNLAASCHLDVLVVAEAPSPPATSYDVVNGTAWLEAGQAARKDADAAADAIRTQISAKGQNASVSAHVAGPVHLSDLVATAARCTDLVLHQTGAQPSSLGNAVLQGALFESGTPLIVFDPQHPPKSAPETVVIAWKATPEGGRAVRAALPFLKTAKRVIAVLIDPHPAPRGFGQEPGYDLAVYLGHHGISLDVQKLPSEGKPVSELLTHVIEAEAADLLVMGAYGHARLRQRIFGGTTQKTLAHPPCPTLLMH